jgi:6,7-dimethyl-8-ribityllumazine synthase
MATVDLSSYDKASLPSISGIKVGIVVAEWNEQVTEGLYKGCEETFLDYGLTPKDIIRKNVPGSFELPMGAQFMLENTDVDAVICIGSVIQGETKHFDFVCETTALGIKDVALKYNKPVMFGVLTDNTMQQAIDRSGGEKGNKGVEAAVTAIKMIALQQSFR